MKKINSLLIAALMVAISISPGCSIFKKREKSLSTTSFSQRSESKTKSDSSAKKTDKTVIVEKEITETSTESPAVNIKKDTEGVSFSDLAKGIKSIDSGLYSVKVTYDSAAKKLTTEVERKPEKTNTKKTTERTTYKDLTDETTHNTEKQNKDATTNETKQKTNISTPKGLGWLWAVIVSVVIVVVVGLLAYFGKLQNLFKKNKPS